MDSLKRNTAHCANCGKEFVPDSVFRDMCSNDCYQKYREKKDEEYKSIKETIAGIFKKKYPNGSTREARKKFAKASPNPDFTYKILKELVEDGKI